MTGDRFGKVAAGWGDRSDQRHRAAFAFERLDPAGTFVDRGEP